MNPFLCILAFFVTFSESLLSQSLNIKVVEKEIFLQSDHPGIFELQSSKDGENFFFSDVIVVPLDERPDALPKFFAAPPTEEEKKFYRLKKYDEQTSFSFEANSLSHSEHLGRATYGNNFEVNFFGRRNSFGEPEQIESVTMRLGNDVLNFKDLGNDPSLRFPDLGPDYLQTDFSNVTTFKAKGDLVVARTSENAIDPSGIPQIKFSFPTTSDGSAENIIIPRYTGSLGLYDFYEYEIILGQSIANHIVDKWGQFFASLGCTFGGVPKKIGRLGDLNILDILPLVSYFVCAADLEANPIRTWPPEYDREDSWSLSIIEIQGFFKDVGTGGCFSSNKEVAPVGGFPEIAVVDGEIFTQLPTLIIDIGENTPEEITITKTFSVASTMGEEAERSDTITFDFVDEIEKLSPRLISKARWVLTGRFGDSSVTLDFSPQNVARDGSVTANQVLELISSVRKPAELVTPFWNNFCFGRNGCTPVPFDANHFTFDFPENSFHSVGHETTLRWLNNYYSPLEINVFTGQGIQRVGGFGIGSSPAKVVEQTGATCSGSLSITLTLQ